MAQIESMSGRPGKLPDRKPASHGGAAMRKTSRNLRHLSLAALGILGAVSAADAQTAVHPGFGFSSLRPAGFDPMVSGLDFLPDGRLVVSTWEGFGATKGSVWIVGNAQTGD